MSQGERFRSGGREIRVPLPFPVDRLRSDPESRPAPVEDLAAAVASALAHPLDGPPLAERLNPGDPVSLVVDDHTRTTPTGRFLPPLVRYLEERGHRRSDLQVVIAHGVHRPAIPDEVARILGPELRDLPVLVHDARAPCTHLGTTSRGTPVRINRRVAETRIVLTGDVELHYFAGYGGSRKSLLPGVAAWDSVEANHRLMLNRTGSTLGELRGVDVHEDMLEAARMAEPAFTLNVVRDPERRVVAALGGSMEAVLESGAALVDRIYKVPIPGRYDLVLCDMGGHPRDRTFFQAWKAVESALEAVRDGGTVVLMAACREGWGNAGYETIMAEHPLPPRAGRSLHQDGLREEYLRVRDAIRERLRRDYLNGGNKAYFQYAAVARVDLVLLSELPAHEVDSYQVIPAASPAELVRFITRKHGEKPSALIIPDAGTWLPMVEGE